jgi:hypothetical protein
MDIKSVTKEHPDGRVDVHISVPTLEIADSSGIYTGTKNEGK